MPTNLPELYTQPSRMICIKWQNDQPEIYMAKLPAIDTANLFLEPMTTWRYNKKNNNFIPNMQSKYNIGKDMWQNFGEYFNPNISTLHQPGQITIWQKQCYQLAKNVINQFMQTITRRDMAPDKNGKTIFNYRSLALYKAKEALSLNDTN